MDRPIQVGDIADVIVNDQTYSFPIKNIATEGISVPPYLIVQDGSIWKIQGYNIPHQVIFRPNVFDELLDRFLQEAKSLSGRQLVLKTGPRFISLVYHDGGFEHTFARVEKLTGDVYSQSGQTPRGNLLTSLYGGLELIGKYGVIVNRQKAAARLQELQ